MKVTYILQGRNKVNQYYAQISLMTFARENTYIHNHDKEKGRIMCHIPTLAKVHVYNLQL